MELDTVHAKILDTKNLIKYSRNTMREYLMRHVMKPSTIEDDKNKIGKLEAYRLFIAREL